MQITANRDIYNVKNVATRKVVEVGFDNKMDAKDKRNELSAKTWEKWKKKKMTILKTFIKVKFLKVEQLFFLQKEQEKFLK